MRDRFPIRDPLLAHPWVRWCAIASTALLAVAWIAILALPRVAAADAYVTRYTSTFGIAALGDWRGLLELPIIGTAILLVNFSVARLRTRTAEVPPSAVLLAVATLLLESGVAGGAIVLLTVNW